MLNRLWSNYRIHQNNIKSSKKSFTENLDKRSDKARVQLKNKLLKDAAGNFFSNEGFKKGSEDAPEYAIDSKNGGDRNLKNVKERSEGYIDDIEMAFLFEKTASAPGKTDSNSALSNCEITDEYIGKCRKLFITAQSSKLTAA